MLNAETECMTTPLATVGCLHGNILALLSSCRAHFRSISSYCDSSGRDEKNKKSTTAMQGRSMSVRARALTLECSARRGEDRMAGMGLGGQ